MVSLFANLDRAMTGAVEGVFAEAVRLIPRREGKYSAGGADLMRQPFDCRAIVTEGSELQRLDGDGVGSNWGAELNVGAIRISIAKGALPYALLKGDHIQVTTRQGLPLFEVITVDPDNASRIVLRCTKVVHP